MLCCVQAVGCGAEQEQDLAQATSAALQGGAQVVVVCAPGAAGEHSASALKAELEQLGAVQKAAVSADAGARFVYTTQPARASVVQRRSLLGYKGFGPYTACGPLCQVRNAL